MRTAGFVFAAFASLFLLVGAGLFAREWSFLRKAKTAPGTVVRLDERQRGTGRGMTRTYAPVFAFEVEGKRYEIVSNVASNPPSAEVGDEVEVLYDPDDPNRAEVRSFLSQWFLPLLFSVIGLVLAVVAAVLLRR